MTFPNLAKVCRVYQFHHNAILHSANIQINIEIRKFIPIYFALKYEDTPSQLPHRKGTNKKLNLQVFCRF